MRILPTFKALQAKKQQNVQTNPVETKKPDNSVTEKNSVVEKDEFIKIDNGTVVEVKK